MPNKHIQNKLKEFRERFSEGLSSPKLCGEKLLWNNRDGEVEGFLQQALEGTYQKGREDGLRGFLSQVARASERVVGGFIYEGDFKLLWANAEQYLQEGKDD